MLTYTRFASLWAKLGAQTDPKPVYANIVQRYCEPHRQYHTLEHIDFCLQRVDDLEWCLSDRRETIPIENKPEIGIRDLPVLEMIMIGHDHDYDLLRKDNEEQSAEHMNEYLREAGVTESIRSQVIEGILPTKPGSAVPQSVLALTAVDIDIAIFGASPEIFDRYEANIELEYSPEVIAKLTNIPLGTDADRKTFETLFCAERSHILKNYLDKEDIFNTRYFNAYYGTQAKSNLTRSLAKLKARLEK